MPEIGKLWKLITASLHEVNPVFMSHGMRVAYAVYRFSEYLGAPFSAKKRLVSAAMFHEMGAYETDKLDKLMAFDVTGTYDHALKGYLFLKYFSPLGKDAALVLYHHSYYKELKKKYVKTATLRQAAARREGRLIHLADRFDTLFQAGLSAKEISLKIASCPPYMFGKRLSDSFTDFLARSDVWRKLNDGVYEGELSRFLCSTPLSGKEASGYLKMLVWLFELHSQSTLYHSATTSAVAGAIAEKMGFSEREIKSIRTAGLIHDLGKIKTPLSVLEKPGPLNETESEEMKKHVIYTSRLCDGYFSPEILCIAARHHEKLDGSGYPDGLTAAQLSPAERLMCVADIISALKTRRSYKDVFPEDRIVCILKESAAAGKIDESIVNVYLDSADYVNSVAEKANSRIEKRYLASLSEYEKLKDRTIGP